MAAAAESDTGSEAPPTGDSAVFASPVKARARARARAPESEAGASAATASESSEARVDDGNIQEAESSLREGLSLNYEVCSRCLQLLCFLIWDWEVACGMNGRNGMERSEKIGIQLCQCDCPLLYFGGKDRDLCAEIVVPTWTDGSSWKR